VKKRLFIALDICDEARAAASKYIDSLRSVLPSTSVKWEAPEKLHLTLKFLGSTEEHLLDEIIRVVNNGAKLTRAFDIKIARTGVFPSTKNPRVLWLGVNEPSGTMRFLAELIDQECFALGFEKESRVFKPHLTIARIRDPRGSANLGREHQASSFGPLRCLCGEIVLYESKLGRRGSTYIKLATAKFNAS
jgi:2'-5' RNA ligase